jgi:hypothetical protein
MTRLGGSFRGSRRESEGARAVGAAQWRRLPVLARHRGGGSQRKRCWHEGEDGREGGVALVVGGRWEGGAALVVGKMTAKE